MWGKKKKGRVEGRKEGGSRRALNSYYVKISFWRRPVTCGMKGEEKNGGGRESQRAEHDYIIPSLIAPALGAESWAA